MFSITVSMVDRHTLPEGSRPSQAICNNGPNDLAFERFKPCELTEGWPMYRDACEWENFESIFGGLLASAILSLDRFGSTKRWEMVFAIEGIITIGLAVIAFFTLTDSPETARWLTPEEKELAINRVLSERVGTTELLDKLDQAKTLRGIFNPVVLSTSLALLLVQITVQGFAFFLPTIIRTIYPHKPLCNSSYSLCHPTSSAQ